MSDDAVDIGLEHRMRYTQWAPDRELNPQYEGIPDVPKWGLLIEHPKKPGDEACGWDDHCIAAVTFESEVQHLVAPDRTVWQVQSWDPLTISPSIGCHCGDHGFIQEGRWVAAVDLPMRNP
jgi:hypothetical protein